MVPRPKYKAMLKRAKSFIDQMAESPGPFGVSASLVFSCVRINVNGKLEGVSREEAVEAWPHITKQLGLVQDDYGEWSLPGREMTPQQLEKALNRIGMKR